MKLLIDRYQKELFESVVRIVYDLIHSIAEAKSSVGAIALLHQKYRSTHNDMDTTEDLRKSSIIQKRCFESFVLQKQKEACREM